MSLTCGILAGAYDRFLNTWFEQSQERRTLLKKMLLGYVNAEAGIEKKNTWVQVIEDPYKDKLDDLLELVNERG